MCLSRLSFLHSSPICRKKAAATGKKKWAGTWQAVATGKMNQNIAHPPAFACQGHQGCGHRKPGACQQSSVMLATVQPSAVKLFTPGQQKPKQLVPRPQQTYEIAPEMQQNGFCENLFPQDIPFENLVLGAPIM